MKTGRWSLTLVSLAVAIGSLIVAARERSENAELENRIASLEQTVHSLRGKLSSAPKARRIAPPLDDERSGTAKPVPPPTEAPAAPQRTDAPRLPDPETSAVSFSVDSRLRAIENLVRIDESQRERLRGKFEAEARARRTGAEPPATESLEDIIGESDAEFFRSEVRKAFQRNKNESIEKDALWLSRRLGLDPEREARLQTAMFDAAQKAADEAAADGEAADMRSRMRRMIRENELREEYMAKALKDLLSPDQYEEYARIQADASARDMGVFHAAE